MYEKIQPLLENLHRNFTETRNNISERSGMGRAGQQGGLDVIPAPSQSRPWGGAHVPGSFLDMCQEFFQLNLGQSIRPSLLGAPGCPAP